MVFQRRAGCAAGSDRYGGQLGAREASRRRHRLHSDHTGLGTMKLAVLGAGAWGTALAVTLSGRAPGHAVGRDPEQCAPDARRRASITLSSGHRVARRACSWTSDHAATLADCECAILAVTVAALRETLRGVAARRTVRFRSSGCARASKPAARSCLIRSRPKSCAEDAPRGVLSGPSFAQEVARGIPAAVTLAADDARVRGAHGARAAHAGACASIRART